MKGAEIGGIVVEAVQTEGQEFQLLQDGLLLGLVRLVFLEGYLLFEVAEMAAEGGLGDAILPGQAAARVAALEAPVDLGPGGVVADGAAFIHLKTVFRFQFSVSSKRIMERLSGEGTRAPTRVGRLAEKGASPKKIAYELI